MRVGATPSPPSALHVLHVLHGLIFCNSIWELSHAESRSRGVGRVLSFGLRGPPLPKADAKNAQGAILGFGYMARSMGRSGSGGILPAVGKVSSHQIMLILLIMCLKNRSHVFVLDTSFTGFTGLRELPRAETQRGFPCVMVRHVEVENLESRGMAPRPPSALHVLHVLHG